MNKEKIFERIKNIAKIQENKDTIEKIKEKITFIRECNMAKIYQDGDVYVFNKGESRKVAKMVYDGEEVEIRRELLKILSKELINLLKEQIKELEKENKELLSSL